MPPDYADALLRKVVLEEGRVLGQIARTVALGLGIALTAGTTAAPAGADPPVPTHSIGAAPLGEGPPGVVSNVAAQQGSKASEFTVSYENVPEAAKPAIDHAVEIWERQVASAAETLVRVIWGPVPAEFVSQWQARHVMRDPSSHPTLLPGLRYPSALAHAIRGSRTSEDADIEITLSASFPDWYLGVDGRPQEAQLDLVTVVLWSLVGGSGLTSGFNLTAGAATVTPTIFDTFVAMPGGTAVYQHSAASMAEALVSGMLVFSGSNARVANGGMAPRLHAPPEWRAGVGVQHLDQSYQPPDPDSLSGPFLYRGWALHDPGPITLAILKDIGWSIPGEGVAWRLRVTSPPPLGIPEARPVPALHVQLQDAIGAPVTSVGAPAVGLTFLFAGTSPTVDFDCPGSFSRPLTNGQAVFEGCDITGTGRGYFRLSAAGLVPGVTRAFLFGNLQRRVAPLVAHGP